MSCGCYLFTKLLQQPCTFGCQMDRVWNVPGESGNSIIKTDWQQFLPRTPSTQLLLFCSVCFPWKGESGNCSVSQRKVMDLMTDVNLEWTMDCLWDSLSSLSISRRSNLLLQTYCTNTLGGRQAKSSLLQVEEGPLRRLSTVLSPTGFQSRALTSIWKWLGGLTLSSIMSNWRVFSSITPAFSGEYLWHFRYQTDARSENEADSEKMRALTPKQPSLQEYVAGPLEILDWQSVQEKRCLCGPHSIDRPVSWWKFLQWEPPFVQPDWITWHCLIFLNMMEFVAVDRNGWPYPKRLERLEKGCCKIQRG